MNFTDLRDLLQKFRFRGASQCKQIYQDDRLSLRTPWKNPLAQPLVDKGMKQSGIKRSQLLKTLREHSILLRTGMASKKIVH
ncbi:hypothetical protein [Nostoc sp.]|uniref:hypothetical protein n=1 Tax=Nostoc sp. TaxID=1180 RepID=UPI002FF7F314